MGTCCSLFVGRVNGHTVVRISGELDHANASRLEDALALLDGPLVVECAEIEFIDFTALRVLVDATESHDSVTLRYPSPLLRKLAKLAGWEQLLGLDAASS